MQSVIKPTLGSLTLLNIRELILERNHLNIIHVGEASLGALSFTLESSFWRETI